MKILPFNYSDWSINKDSLEILFMGEAVYSLNQHENPEGIRLVGYVSRGLSHFGKYRLMEWDINGEDVKIPSVDEYKLMMKWKNK